MSNFIYYEKLEDYEEQVRKAKECDEKDKEIERLKDLCNKYEEEHRTTFEEWKKTINIINELEKELKDRIKNVPDTMAEVEEDESILYILQELKGGK